MKSLLTPRDPSLVPWSREIKAPVCAGAETPNALAFVIALGLAPATRASALTPTL